MNDKKQLKGVEQELVRGRYKVYDQSEVNKLLKYYKEKDTSHPRILELESMLPEYNSDPYNTLGLLIELVASNSALLCYIFMTIAHLVDGSVISFIYPLSIFCFALIKEIRPSKTYWQFILAYTTIILLLKSIVRSYLFTYYLPENIKEFMKEYRYGLYADNFDQFDITYYLFDVLILLFVVLHII